MSVSPSVRRLAALGLLFALCWAVVTLWALPLAGLVAGEHARAASSRQLLSRYLQLGATAPALQRQFDALDASAGGKSFLQARSPALMAAEMQGTAQGLVAAAGAALRSSRTLPLAREEGFDRIGIELDLVASTPALSKLLYVIETAEPVILITHLAVRVPENGASASSADGQPLLAVGLRLNSYAQPSSLNVGSQ